MKRVLRTVLVCFAFLSFTFGQQPSLDQLRQKVAELEIRLNDYPALRNVILPDLRAARLDLIQRLQKDLAYFASKAQDGNKDLKAQMDRLTQEISGQNSKLVADASSSSSGSNQTQPQPQTAPAPLPNPNQQQQTAIVQPGTTQMTTHEATTTVQTPGNFIFSDPSTLTLPPGFKYTIDIGRDFTQGNAASICSNRPFGQDVPVWQIKVMLSPLGPDRNPAITSKGTLFTEQNGRNLNILVLVRKEQLQRVTLLTSDKQTYVGTLHDYARSVELIFDHKTLAEASDIVDLLSRHPDQVRAAFNPQTVELEMFQISYSSSDTRTFDKQDFYRALKTKISESDLLKTLRAAAASSAALKIPTPTNSLTPSTDQLEIKVQEFTAINTPGLQNLLNNVEIDSHTLQLAKTNLKFLIDHGFTFKSTDPRLSAALADNDPANAPPAAARDAAAKQIMVVDNPCYQFSVAPLMTGTTGFQPAASFKFRYDYYSFGDALVFKIRGEGEGADNSKYFQRVKVNGESTIFLVKEKGGFQVVGGGLGSYSFTRPNGILFSEWRAGGKLEIKTPVLWMFNQLAGADSKPTFSFEGSGAGGDATPTTDFDFRGKFVYTLRAAPKLSMDFNAAGGVSNAARFGNSKNFSYVDFRSRYNFNSDWDYIVRYQCGKQDPNYIKFCGWQTGFAYVTGR